MFDSSMTWKAPADYMYKDGGDKSSILGRARSFEAKEVVILVYNTIILSLCDHCDISLSNLLQQDVNN